MARVVDFQEGQRNKCAHDQHATIPEWETCLTAYRDAVRAWSGIEVGEWVDGWPSRLLCYQPGGPNGGMVRFYPAHLADLSDDESAALGDTLAAHVGIRYFPGPFGGTNWLMDL